jgi:hypothetical protein
MAAFEEGARFHGEGFPARIAFMQTGPRGLAAQPPGADASAMGTDRPVRPDPAFDESISGMFVLDQTDLHGNAPNASLAGAQCHAPAPCEATPREYDHRADQGSDHGTARPGGLANGRCGGAPRRFRPGRLTVCRGTTRLPWRRGRLPARAPSTYRSRGLTGSRGNPYEVFGALRSRPSADRRGSGAAWPMPVERLWVHEITFVLRVPVKRARLQLPPPRLVAAAPSALLPGVFHDDPLLLQSCEGR